MSRIIRQLRESGIFGYGSTELTTYERRLSRFFSRSYAPYLTRKKSVPGKQTIVTNEGPVVLHNKELMVEHYDKQLPLFQSFLDSHYMAYTMAYYGEEPDEIINNTFSLEAAQERKFQLIYKRAGLTGREKILNLGCGFGAFETYLSENHEQIRVTSLTSSKVQAAYMQECFDDPKHPLKRQQCHLLQSTFGDDENADLIGGEYDAVFAIGLFEHVNNLHGAFDWISRFLAPGGCLFLHLIVSIPEFPQYQDSSRTLIGRYFPGGRIWPFQSIAKDNDFFTLEGSWYLNGTNYWRTLDEWHRRYWQHVEELCGTQLDIDAIRHWNDFFMLCKAVLFAPLTGSVYGNGHYVFRKKERDR
jgi:cyclopropane-fatty-acyl-phospholipid synthase